VVQDGLAAIPDLRVTEPLGYLEFLNLMANAQLVLTNSSGTQEETTIGDHMWKNSGFRFAVREMKETPI
jgi:UDP-N-acetylglucosamine 2-epimerase